ncbi:hypothetical protein Sango_0504100 [Sesamum angolense]|uniref:Uncharacterized protein n=1 Tax=Sesamum angolense TaxID=2727404 RepID=A0AAE1XD05_9LAMI|nr:hypothetical protein Sango_0504100 [Sesamum angolense]
MNAAFSSAANPNSRQCNSVFLTHKYRKTSARAEIGIFVPRKRRDFPQTQLSVHGIPCTDLLVHEIVQRQSQKNNSFTTLDACPKPSSHPMFLEEAYERCKDICAENAKTFYLGSSSNLCFFAQMLDGFEYEYGHDAGTQLMTEERRKQYGLFMCGAGGQMNWSMAQTQSTLAQPFSIDGKRD